MSWPIPSEQQIRALRSRDPALAAAYDAAGGGGPTPPARHLGGFQTLVFAVLAQQISFQAAAAIYGRLVAYLDGKDPQPGQLRALTPAQLRPLGVSGRKAQYIAGLATAVADDALDLDGLAPLSDDDVRERLTAIRGIGRWTADIFLIWSLARWDVMPSGDITVRRGIALLEGQPGFASPAEVEARAQPWVGLRSVAYRWLVAIASANPVPRHAIRASARPSRP
jgi:DNA-3-methyladenine glycosylase II